MKYFERRKKEMKEIIPKVKKMSLYESSQVQNIRNEIREKMALKRANQVERVRNYDEDF